MRLTHFIKMPEYHNYKIKSIKFSSFSDIAICDSKRQCGPNGDWQQEDTQEFKIPCR